MNIILQQAIDACSGSALSLIFPGDVWAPDTVALLGAVVSPTNLVYADEDELGPSGEYRAPRFKPDFSPDFLLSSAYIGRPVAIGSRVVRDLPPLVGEDAQALDDECTLAASRVADSVLHIPEVLCHRSESHLPRTTPPGAPHGEAAGPPSDAEGSAGSPPLTHRISPAATNRSISILVPFRDEPRFLRTCVDSVVATTRSLDTELVLIDNGSTDLEVLTLLEDLERRSNVRIVSDPRPFNWAQLNNDAARAARGEVLLFLNNDIEARRDGWLDVLAGHALRPDIGAVGARLLYPDGRLQHCGVVIGLIGAAGHPLVGLAPGEPGYLDMAVTTRESSAVTGACLATRREIFELLDGFDESLGIDLNDIDYCLRASAAGYRVIYEPRAELVHHESPSRGTAGGVEDIVNFIDRWSDCIASGDPYFSPHLSRTSPACQLARPEEHDRWNKWHSDLIAR
jgi:GT2 family glycosyltransferase